MLRSETVKMFALIKSLFPRDEAFKNATPDMVNAWTDMLQDIPFDAGCAAIKAAVSTSPFPPSIAEIRDYATRLNGPRRMTAEEAWGHACDVMRNYGTRVVLKEGTTEKPPEYTDVTVERHVYRCVAPQQNNRQYEAERHCDPEVWRLLKNLGYKSVVESENPDVVRGQFMRAWNGHNEEAKEYRVISPIVPELFIGSGLLHNLLNDGENGEEL